MKTTIELPDALFAQARRFAQAHDMTMKAMVEEGLRKVMAAKKGRRSRSSCAMPVLEAPVCRPNFRVHRGSRSATSSMTPSQGGADDRGGYHCAGVCPSPG